MNESQALAMIAAVLLTGRYPLGTLSDFINTDVKDALRDANWLMEGAHDYLSDLDDQAHEAAVNAAAAEGDRTQ